MRVAVLAVVGLLMLGCLKSDPATRIHGTWSVTQPFSMRIAFAEGGRFQAQPDGTSEVEGGTYSVEGDHLTFHHEGAGSEMLDQTYKVQWEGKDKLRLTFVLPESADPQWTKRLRDVSLHLVKVGTGQKLEARPASSVRGAQASNAETEQRACLDNVKQIGLALLMYSQDYDDTWVEGPWSQQLAPYIKNERVLNCPTLVNKGLANGYALNSENEGVRTSRIQNPATTPSVFEVNDLRKDAVTYISDKADPPRHVDGNTVGYVDGHAKIIP